MPSLRFLKLFEDVKISDLIDGLRMFQPSHICVVMIPKYWLVSVLLFIFSEHEMRTWWCHLFRKSRDLKRSSETKISFFPCFTEPCSTIDEKAKIVNSSRDVWLSWILFIVCWILLDLYLWNPDLVVWGVFSNLSFAMKVKTLTTFIVQNICHKVML